MTPGYCEKCAHPDGYHGVTGECSMPAKYGRCKCHKASSVQEAKYLNYYDPREFPIITTTVDVVTQRWNEEEVCWEVVLIKRKNFPHKGQWALPGGFVDAHETTQDAARREVKEEAGLDLLKLSFLTVADNPGRDPRGRVISLIYLAQADGEPFAGDDAVEARWFSYSEANVMDLAFDHNEILEKS